MRIPLQRSFIFRQLDRNDWLLLGKLVNSFLGRAISLLSLTSLFLANFAEPLQKAGIHISSVESVVERIYVGSALFLAGSTVYFLRAPSQFSRGGDIHEIVNRMKSITDWAYFESLRGMAEKAITRLAPELPWFMPDSSLHLLETRVQNSRAVAQHSFRSEDAAGLYQAYLNAIRYERPWSRWLSLTLLLAGTIVLFAPAATNVFEAARSIIW